MSQPLPSKLPINLLDLLRQRTVEGERIEYKKAGIQTPSFARCVHSPTTLKTWAAAMW